MHIVTSEGQKTDYFRDLFCVISRNTKHVLFRVFYKYENYCVLIGSKYSRNICFDSVFNRKFDYVHGTHCLTVSLWCCFVYLFVSLFQVMFKWVVLLWLTLIWNLCYVSMLKIDNISLPMLKMFNKIIISKCWHCT